MGSMPLPALDIKTPQQPDLLAKYAQLQQLRGEQQAQQGQRQQLQMQQQEAPLRMQTLQQGVQTGAIDLEQKKIQMKDQQAMSSAMQEWGNSKPDASSALQTPTGDAENNPASSSAPGSATSIPSAGAMSATPAPRYEDLIGLAIKNGASANTVMGLKKNLLDMQSTASTIAKNDAQTGASNASAMKTKIGLVTDALSGVASLPDAQLAQGILTASNDLSQKGLLDPQHVQMAQALAQQAQSGDTAGARQHLEIQIKSMGGFADLLTNAQKQVELDQAQGKTDPTSTLYAPTDASVAMGTAPGAAQIQSGKVKQAASVAAADAAARQPFEVRLAQIRQSLTQGDPNDAGQLLVNGDATLSELKTRGATPQFIEAALNAARRLSGGKYNAQQADAQFAVARSPAQLAFFGSSKSLTDPGGTLDQLSAAGKNLPGGKFPALNSIADWEKAATGSGPIAQYASTALGIADDYAKVVGGGVGTDTARTQALALVPKSASPEAREAAIQGIRGTIHSQMNSRIGANPILQRMYGDANTAAQSGMAQGAGQNSGNNAFAQFGGVAH
jgi:hypothetical protein